MLHLYNNKTSKSDLIQFNGDYILDNLVLNQKITEGLNDDFSLEAEILVKNDIDINLYNAIVEDALLKANDEYGTEYFRIAQVRKNKRSITIFARHITISDILTMWCEDVRPTNLNGQGALTWIFDNAKGDNWFNVSSNIATQNTAYYQNKNVYQCLFDSDNSFLDRWGGEVKRQGFNITINDEIGADRGVSIRSRKNLLGFEAQTNINSLITRIYPKGYNGITIEEKFVDSPIIGNYSKVYSREIKFDDIRVNDEEYTEGFATLAEAQEELKNRCVKMFEVEKIDVISAYYRVDFVNLEKTEEYKNYSILETTWLGDIINVYEENLDININVRVVKRVYDCIREMRKETELSNKDIKIKPPSITDVMKELDKIPDNIENTLQQAKEYASNLINAGINGYVVVNKNEILIMNTNDKNTATKVWRYNINGLGYSSTGYYGEYGLAMTMDGQIVADFITAGILNANIIKAGIIKGFNENLSINLDTGEVNFKKGRIEGLNSSWDLNTGSFKTIRMLNGKLLNELELFEGSLDSSTGLQLRSLKNITLRYLPDGYLQQSKASIHLGEDYNPAGGGQVGINATKIFLQGEVYINGIIVQNKIATLENAMLMNEGLI